MYIVKNITHNVISIRDLRVTIEPDQQIDLDLVADHNDVISSHCLQHELVINHLQRVMMSHVESTVISPHIPEESPTKKIATIHSGPTVNDLMETLRDNLNSAGSINKSTNNPQPPNENKNEPGVVKLRPSSGKE